ncbi:hypothetical protein I4300191C4_15540 [Solibaculum mannosilyticum]|nr:hypothetical protein BN3661_00576 [Eubacteriaceae bacterium CHKCI005]
MLIMLLKWICAILEKQKMAQKTKAFALIQKNHGKGLSLLCYPIRMFFILFFKKAFKE